MKSNLIKFVLKRQLAEYGIMFADSEDGAWLDKVTLFYGLFNMEIISDLIIKLGPMVEGFNILRLKHTVGI